MRKTYLILLITLLNFISIPNTYGQYSDSTNQLVEQIAHLITEHYVIQENSSFIVDELYQLRNSGKYDTLRGKQLAKTLTIDIKRISQDKHFRVHFSEERVKASKQKSTERLQSKLADGWKILEKENNFGFPKTELLEGNIGYIKIDEFTNPNYSEDTFVKCIDQIKGSDGLVIDLNDCIGGSGSMVWLIISYFLEKKPVTHLMTYSCPFENIDLNILTRKKIKGSRLPDIPIYVLISNKTYSAGESFSYTLKHINRAILVGDTTKGGAHSWKEFPLNDSMSIQVPTCRFTHPITGTDWENKGVIPDIKASVEDSKTVAQIELIKLLQSKAEVPSTDYMDILKRLQAALKNKN
ncbi:MAG: S41 family peptidase [Crocinitomicaceae bacterium]|nr:S41 family peptidase [Flavobacteriales bacterium]NQZ37502.1 S41 family peptidase [Crocinitomicaceae bacterium]